MKITLKGIEKRFGARLVIPPLDLVLTGGRFTTLLGPSGCGKTTLLRMIAGLETPDAGEIWFDDSCIFSKEGRINLPPEKRELGFVFQDFSLWPHMPVFENVAFGLRARRQTGNLSERVKAALRAVHLGDFADRYPHQLSGGQQQRVAFARALVIKPRCILCDEPFSALDAVLREEMRAELKELMNNLGITTVFVTHDQVEAMGMSDEIAVMNAGRVEQKGIPEEIYRRPATPFVARFVGRSNWIGKDRMFRPEDLLLEPRGNAEVYQARLKSVRFIGNGYELCFERDNDTWFALSPHSLGQGDISVFVKNDSILKFNPPCTT
ncbi:MAG: ABC transporter ATP-binding protein [Treponema sp.]|nr:ABC transporter ATP-binding protein [Treponema sp.]